MKLIRVIKAANINTKFFNALHRYDFDKVKELIDSGIDVNIKDSGGWTPLMYLTRPATLSDKENFELIKLLVNAGADVNIQDDKGNSPFNLSILQANENTIKLLLNVGADVNLENKYTGETPLMLAIREGNDTVIKLLLKNGADINYKNKLNITPLQYAKLQKRKYIIDLLKEYGAK